VSSKIHNISHILLVHMTLGMVAERHTFCPFLVLFQKDFIIYKENVAVIIFTCTLEVIQCKSWLNLRLLYVMTYFIFTSFEGEF